MYTFSFQELPNISSLKTTSDGANEEDFEFEVPKSIPRKTDTDSKAAQPPQLVEIEMTVSNYQKSNFGLCTTVQVVLLRPSFE